MSSECVLTAAITVAMHDVSGIAAPGDRDRETYRVGLRSAQREREPDTSKEREAARR
jgi:hypothetical protein